MPKFNVNVVRIGYASMYIEVEADTEELARDKALDTAGNHLFSEHSSEYDAESVVRVDNKTSEVKDESCR